MLIKVNGFPLCRVPIFDSANFNFLGDEIEN